MRLLGFKSGVKCQYPVASTSYSTLSTYIKLLLPTWQRTKPALLLATFLCASVPSQANIFDPLLRILIPSYSSETDDTHGDQPQPSSNKNATDTNTPKDTDETELTNTPNNPTTAVVADQSIPPKAHDPLNTAKAINQDQSSNRFDESTDIVFPDDGGAEESTDYPDQWDDEDDMLDEAIPQGHHSRTVIQSKPSIPADPDNSSTGTTQQLNGKTNHLSSSTLSSKNTTSTPVIEEPSLYALLDAEFAIDRGEVERGLALYKQQSFKEDATAVFERALTLSLSYEPTETSLAFATSWQQQHPDHVPAWFYVAHLALKAHDYALAGETLSRILQYDPRADLSEILIGIYPNKEQDQRDLLATLQPLDSTHNDSLSVLKAGLLLKFNEPRAALLHVDQALKLQPNTVPVITLKADILRQLADPEEVLTYIQQARLRLPNQKSLYLYEIRYLLEYQQSRPAWELLLEANKRFENDAEITLLAALVSLDIEEYAQADHLLNTLAKNASYLDQAYYYLGISAERQHKFTQAKGYFNSVMQEDLVLAARKKVVAFELIDNNIDAAIATLKQLRKQFEVFAPDSYILQADILRQQGAIEEAQSLLATASRQYPDNEALLFARAELLDDREDFIVKRTILTHLMSMSPDDLDYQLDYAELLLANDANSERGLEIATSIMQIHFDDPKYENDRHLESLNILASSALANQDYDQVIDYLQTPYDVSPTLRSGVLLLRAYQGLQDTKAVNDLLEDLQRRFSFGQQNVNDIIQQY